LKGRGFHPRRKSVTPTDVIPNRPEGPVSEPAFQQYEGKQQSLP